MEEFLGSLRESRRFQGLIFSWLTPIFLAALLFVVFLLPDLKGSDFVSQVSRGVSSLGVSKPLFTVLVAALFAVLAFVNRRHLYGLLEGILWPEWLNKWRTQAHGVQFRYFEALEALSPKLSAAEREQTTKELGRKRKDRGMSWLRWVPRRQRPLLTPRNARSSVRLRGFPVYPPKESQVMPTRFGNRMRAMETYGVRTYSLDSQTMWNELLSSVPDSVRNELDSGEETTDALVCSFYCAIALTAASTAAIVWRALTDRGFSSYPAALLVASAVGTWIIHRALIASIETWEDGVRALVNIGRVRLAEQFGLVQPAGIKAEREMWKALVGATYFAGTDQGQRWQAKLDKFRAAKRQTGRPSAAPAKRKRVTAAKRTTAKRSRHRA